MKDFILSLIALMVYFYSSGQWTCGQNFTDVRDEQNYRTIMIGNQCWMRDNLNIGTMIQLTGAGQLCHDDAIIEKFCWNNDADFCNGDNGKTKKGGYYEFKEAVQYYSGQPAKPVQGICPTGWHIPDQNEWATLVSYLGGTSAAYPELLNGGSSAFDANYWGYKCTMTGTFRNGAYGIDATYFWAADQGSLATYGIFLVLDSGTPTVQIWEYDKSIGIHVRCIKDSPSSIPDFKETGFSVNLLRQSSDNEIIFGYKNKTNSGFQATLFSTEGKEILNTSKQINPGEGEITISIPNYLEGICILKLQTDNEVITKKIFIY